MVVEVWMHLAQDLIGGSEGIFIFFINQPVPDFQCNPDMSSRNAYVCARFIFEASSIIILAFTTMARFNLAAAVILSASAASAFAPSQGQSALSSRAVRRQPSAVNYEYIFSSISPIGIVGGKNKKTSPAPKPVEKAPAPAAEAPKEEAAEEKEAAAPAASVPASSSSFDEMVKAAFPGAISNTDLKAKAVAALTAKGYTPENTLLCTSLCCDELARNLEQELVDIYGRNFNLGGLAGFPFAGNTGFGAMSAHIPDDGCCFFVHGPHVGITKVTKAIMAVEFTHFE